MMNDQLVLAVIAAIALAFQVQALQNLAPVLWVPAVTQTVSLCTDVDLNTGCGFSLASADHP